VLKPLLFTSLLAFLSGGPGAPWSEAQVARGDSLRPFELRGVTVSAPQVRIPSERASMRLSILTRQSLSESNGATVGELLRQTPGLVIRGYGGGGGMQLPSFRGLAAEHTLVMIDGVPVNSQQSGLIDLRMLPTQELSSVELVRGGLSALYGSNAMGGVINLRTAVPRGPATVRAHASSGSFGETGVGLGVRAPLGDFMVRAGVSRERGDGRYAVNLTDRGPSGAGIRRNNDYLSEHVEARADWLPADDRASGWMSVSATRFDRGAPGPLVSVESQGDGRQSDELTILQGALQRHDPAGPEWSLHATIQRADEHYVDTTGVFQGDNTYRTMIAGLSPAARLECSPALTLRTGVDVDATEANGNALDGTRRRARAGVFASAEIHTPGVADEGTALSLLPALRYEATSTAAPSWNPQLGATAVHRSDPWTVAARASFGRSYRIPTLNELYYRGAGGFGNPALGAETAVNAEAGIGLTYEGAGKWDASITGYAISSRDRIIWRPATTAFVWSPVNVARSKSRGFEAELSWQEPTGLAEIAGSYAYLDVTDRTGDASTNPAFDHQLPYIPLETASASMTFRIPTGSKALRRVVFRIEHAFLGKRYTSDGNSAGLEGTHLIGGNCALDLAFLGAAVTIKYELENATAAAMEEMPGYPLPPTRHRVSITFEHELLPRKD
jgi:outer membrane cobalamin receptor